MALAIIAPRPNSHPFQERQIHLKEPVKIGRAVAKSKPNQANGIFDCKVLSRNHAIIWYENNKFLLQDTKSSNGTFINNIRLSQGAEESQPYELKSGDTIQFGVDVVESSKNVTHGCVVATVTLFHPDGTEAGGSSEDTTQGILSLLNAEKSIDPQDLYQLSQFLQEAVHREQMLENKLATLQRVITESQAAANETFQGFIQEDKLLSRLETLENQLEVVTKDMTIEDAQKELYDVQEQRESYESTAKISLQEALQEKVEVMQKLGDAERLLSNAEDESGHIKSAYEKSQEDLRELMEKHTERLAEVQKLQEEVEASEKRHKSVTEQYEYDKLEMRNQLEDAEKRGSALAVEVESLQAECDFTKKQLESMRERLGQQREQQNGIAEIDSLENEDMEKDLADVPFASDYATLEKDVQNKSAFIKTLKTQLSSTQVDLSEAKHEIDKLKRQYDNLSQNSLQTMEVSAADSGIMSLTSMSNSSTDGVKGLSSDALISQLEYMQKLQDYLGNIFYSVVTTRATLSKLKDGSTVPTENGFGSLEDTNVDLENTKMLPINEQLLIYQKMLAACCKSASVVRDDLKQVVELSASLTTTGDLDKEISNEFENSNELSLREALSTAHMETEEVRRQIILLSEQLTEEQRQNRKTTELASSLEKQLYEAHKHMSIEKLEKSHSYEALQSARNLAEEMQKQASTYARAAGQEKVESSTLFEENASLKMKVTRLESENRKLKNDYSLLSKHDKLQTPMKMRKPSKDRDPSSRRERRRTESANEIDDLQEKLEQAKLTIDELVSRSSEESQKQADKQRQLINLVISLIVLFVTLGAAYLLDIIKVTPGQLPLLDERTWTEVWEHLF